MVQNGGLKVFIALLWTHFMMFFRFMGCIRVYTYIYGGMGEANVLGNSKTRLLKHLGVVGSNGSIFLSSGCKVWGPKSMILWIFSKFGMILYLFLRIPIFKEEWVTQT